MKFKYGYYHALRPSDLIVVKVEQHHLEHIHTHTHSHKYHVLFILWVLNTFNHRSTVSVGFDKHFIHKTGKKNPTMCDWWISLGSRPSVLHVLHVLCCVNLCFCSPHLFETQLINLTPTPTPTVVLRLHCHHPPSQAAEDNSRQREARMTIERDCRCQWSWFPKNWFKWNSEFLWVFFVTDSQHLHTDECSECRSGKWLSRAANCARCQRDDNNAQISAMLPKIHCHF